MTQNIVNKDFRIQTSVKFDIRNEPTNTSKHVSAASCPAEGDVVHLLVVGDELRLHVTRHHVHTTKHLACLYTEGGWAVAKHVFLIKRRVIKDFKEKVAW